MANRKLLSSGLGISVGLLLGALLMLLQGYNPITTYSALLDYSLGGLYPLATTLRTAVPLILTGLSASVAFAAGPVNLGQPGQLVMGALAATVVGLYVDLPAIMMLPLLLTAALAGGAAWSGVAALLRLRFGMSEFITTLMLNMIADGFTLWAITYPLRESGANSTMTPLIAKSGWLPEIGEFNTSIIVTVLAFALIWFVYNHWTAGYEWRITGQNALFARLGGVNIDRNYLAVMLVTGALAGLAGGLVLMGGPHRFLKGLGANYAWDGVMIAVVANNGLIGTVLYGLFFAALQSGALGMELITAVPSEFILVLQAVIVLVGVAGRVIIELWHQRQSARRLLTDPYTGSILLLDGITILRYYASMIKSFKDRETEKIFRRQFSRRLPQDIQRAALRRLTFLHATKELNDLYLPPSNRLEPLAGDRAGQYSMRINEQWRICFEWIENDAYHVEIVDYH